ncbi:hypothetical protein [Nitrosomonas communis]|uniref:Uncharacterized protein n=1 Tax=Nitrosomonas communis TaxID=44574 RepID=A0A1I4NLQ3_9PROT|nr:hypothetical protein [Nitrosomonas communis]SFM16419.1 hypothetical protein SAMN05421863_101560 [Nitrosomonas communis]
MVETCTIFEWSGLLDKYSSDVTRGKQLVVIIAQPKALVMATKTQRSQRRVTNLISRLSING